MIHRLGTQRDAKGESASGVECLSRPFLRALRFSKRVVNGDQVFRRRCPIQEDKEDLLLRVAGLSSRRRHAKGRGREDGGLDRGRRLPRPISLATVRWFSSRSVH